MRANSDSTSTGARRSAARVWAWLVLALALTACAKRATTEQLRGTEYSIREVEIIGNHRFDDDELHPYLELRPNQWFPLPRKHWFYPGLIPVDQRRIVELYHAYGYYDARVLDVRVVTLERKHKVEITIVLDEGEVTTVEEVTVRFPEGAPQEPPASIERSDPLARALRRSLRRRPDTDPNALAKYVRLARGDAFEVPIMEASARAIADALRRAGHPFAEVVPHAEVDPVRRRARVEFEVRPGPLLTIGAIEWLGSENVPERAVRYELDWAEGRLYSPALLERIERRVYGLGVFATVSVQPEAPQEWRSRHAGEPGAGSVSPSEPRGTEEQLGDLALTVRTQDADPQRVRLGVELGFEPNRWEQRVSARYSHDNLFRALYRVSLTGRVGYAEMPNTFNPLEHGPVARLELHGQKQHLLWRGLIWTVDPTFELGIQQGYQFWEARHRFGLSRFFTRWVQLGVAHEVSYVDFFNVSPTLDRSETQLGLDFRDPYILSLIEISATIWAVDQIVTPSNGVVLANRYLVAGGGLGGHFDYHEVEPTLRLYWRPHERVQLAARLRVGLIFPYGASPGAPIDRRRYLGGADTVRGWGLRRLAPRITDCEPGEQYTQDDCESIPVGGNTSVLGNFEVRVRAWRDLWAAVFVDGGDVQPGVMEYHPQQWNYSSGFGLRYASPVGKFRLDIGFRLNDTVLGHGEPIWALHLGLGESF